MLFDSFGVEKFLFVSFFQRFYYRIAPKGKQVYGRNDALLRRVSRTRWNGRGGGGRRESSPIKNNLPSRLVDNVRGG